MTKRVTHLALVQINPPISHNVPLARGFCVRLNTYFPFMAGGLR